MADSTNSQSDRKNSTSSSASGSSMDSTVSSSMGSATGLSGLSSSGTTSSTLGASGVETSSLGSSSHRMGAENEGAGVAKIAEVAAETDNRTLFERNFDFSALRERASDWIGTIRGRIPADFSDVPTYGRELASRVESTARSNPWIALGLISAASLAVGYALGRSIGPRMRFIVRQPALRHDDLDAIAE